MDDKLGIDPLLWHIAFWFALSVGLLAAFFILHGAALASFILFLSGHQPIWA